MADRNFNPFQALLKEIKYIGGTFEIAASGGVATKIHGIGYSVAKSATGEYTITLQDAFSALISANVTIEAAVAVDIVPQIKSQDVTNASKTVVINLNAVATPVEPAAVTRVHFSLFLSNSSLPNV